LLPQKSENSPIWELSKDEQDSAYKSFILIREIETDLQSALDLMYDGKFFDAENIFHECKIKCTISNESMKDFIKILSDKKIWLQLNGPTRNNEEKKEKEA